MSVSIDMGGVSFEDLQMIFEVSDFLDNYKELIKDFTPEVEKILVKEGFFKGPFLIEYRKQFDQLIVRLIKKELVNHFPSYTPEDIMALGDVSLLKLLGPELFIQDNYKTNLKLN